MCDNNSKNLFHTGKNSENKQDKGDRFEICPLFHKSDAFFSPSGTLEIIETHISRVYLTAKFAYKQKKPVNYGFVDYTTLKKRIFFARRELSLNKRACSGGIYLDLIELRQKKDKLFTGFRGGRLIDVFVRMKRIKSESFLNNILKNYYDGGNNDNSNINNDNKVDGILKKAAKKIYLFHKSALTSKRISKFGGYDVYKANWDDNYGMIVDGFQIGERGQEKGTDFKSAPNPSLTPLLKKEGHPKGGVVKEKGTDFKSAPFSSDSFFDGVSACSSFHSGYSAFLKSPLFSEFIRLRSEGGFVKDVHGDLRMEHIAVLDPRRVNGICLMDCVEFDERYRNQDIYLDVAFLLMDFEFSGYFYESTVFFYYYKNCFNYAKLITPFEKYEPSVIPFFKAYRTIVRTKIALLSSEKDSSKKTAKYFKLASFYLVLVKKPVIILNCGLSGSGKSSLSTFLSGYFYARVVSTDKIRRDLYGLEDKSVKYSKEANVMVYENLLKEGLEEFEKGGSVIFDATFLKRAGREKIINNFNKKDCIFILVYSKIYSEKEEIILKRLTGRFDAGSGANANAFSDGMTDFTGHKGDSETDYSEADAAVYFNQKRFFEEPTETEIEPLIGNGSTRGVSFGIFVQIDASLEIKNRFNELMKGIVEEYGKRLQ